MLKKIVLVLSVLLLIILGAAASMHTYLIRDSADAEMLWNRDQAYLFIGVTTRGYDLSYLRYFADITEEHLGGVTSANDKRFSVVVLTITPGVTQRTTVSDIALNFYTPFEDRIYANRQGEMWKWNGTNFERATAEEKQRFEMAGRELQAAFAKAHGWSKEFAIFNRPLADYTIEVGGSLLEVAVKKSPKAELSIDLRRPAHPPERIWQLDGQTRRISKTDYERLFRKP